jgi:hypothetical protein
MCEPIFGVVVESVVACGGDGATVARVVVEGGVIGRRGGGGVVVLGEWDGIAGSDGGEGEGAAVMGRRGDRSSPVVTTELSDSVRRDVRNGLLPGGANGDERGRGCGGHWRSEASLSSKRPRWPRCAVREPERGRG